jgi:hypothetical protein
LKKSALLPVAVVAAGIILVSCNKGVTITKPPSQLTTRVLASQGASSPTAFAGLVIIDGEIDTVARASSISAGSSPGLMVLSPTRATLLVFDSLTNRVGVVNTKTESLSGSIQLPGPTTSMVVPGDGNAYAAVPTAPFNGEVSPGAVVAMNVTSGGVTNTISVPGAQTVVASSNTQLLAFSNDSDAVTVVFPFQVNTGNPVTVTVPGFDRPVSAVIGGDGTIYVLNCGAQCGGRQASVQILDMSTTPPTAGASVPVNGATVGLLSGSTLYVAGKGTPTGPLCTSIPSAGTTSAQYCGTLDIVDLGTMQDPYFNNPASEIAITDGYHDRIDLSSNGQLFIGSAGCTTIGNVNNPQGEVRGCLSIYDTTNASVVIPPDSGDVTGLQGFTTRDVEYVAEGFNLRVYDTTTDKLLANNDFITNGTIVIAGRIIDVKAVDFF